MAGEQFHIFIYDGSNTVAHGRDFLREQDAELNRAMTDFVQGCKDEKEAFDQSVDSMGNQCYNSDQLHEAAKKESWKAGERVNRADGCLYEMQNFIDPATDFVYQAEYAIRTAESEISSCQGSIDSLKQDIANEKNSIEFHETCIKHSQGCIKSAQESLKDATSQDSINTERSRINSANASIEQDEWHINRSRETIASKNSDIEKFNQKLKDAERMKSAAEKALAAARQHLQLCQQKLAEAEALKRKAEALKQKAENNENDALKAYLADDKKLNELKKTAKDSAQFMGELADNSLSIQRNTSDNLADNAAIMDKLAGLMYDYETFSLDGGKL